MSRSVETTLQAPQPAPQSPGWRDTLLWIAAAGFAAALLASVGLKTGIVLGAGLVAVALAAWALSYPEILLAGLMGAAALDVTGRLAKVGGAQITFYQVLLLVVVGFLGWLVIDGRERLKSTPADPWFLLAAVAAAIAVPGARNLPVATVALISFYSSLAVVYIVVGIASTPERLRRALVLVLVLAALLGAAAVVERLGIFSIQPFLRTFADGIRPRVTFDDPNTLGGVLGAAAALGIPIAVAERRVLQALVLWGLIGASLLGLVVTLSRGAWLGFLVGAFVALVFAPMSARVRLGLFAAAAAGLATLFFVVLDPAWVVQKVAGIATDHSAWNRIWLAQAAGQMWLASPFGVGPGMWNETIIAFRPTELPPDLLDSHTTYLTLLVEMGVFGVVGIVVGLFQAGRYTLRAALRGPSAEIRTLAAAGAAGAAVLIVQSMTYSLETSKFLWFMVGAGLAAASFCSTEREEGSCQEANPSQR